MGLIYGLAVALVIFEGIIIQCEGGDAASSNQGQNAPINDIKEEIPYLSNDLIENIVGKSDFKTIHEAVQSHIVPGTNLIMSRLLQDHIIEIDLCEHTVLFPDIYEYRSVSDLYLRICKYQKLVQFFDRFGDQVKKIEIGYSSLNADVPHKEINQNIIKRCAKHLEELRFGRHGDDGFWEEISDGENYIIFPEVRSFQNTGCSTRDKFDLNLIFPKLESLKLAGTVADVNCLANVKGLKELMLGTRSIEEHQLDDIFANNENMTMVHLFMPDRRETMHSIAKYLTKLETLIVEFPGENFWFRADNNEVYILPSVEHIDIVFDRMDEVFGIGNLSFDMPNLKKLTLNGRRTNSQTIINFINYFKKLEKVEFLLRAHIAIECIEALQHIEEITTLFYGTKPESLKKIFDRFDGKSKLQTLKFVYFHDASLYKFNEDEMKEININLKKSMKPTWTQSNEVQFGTSKKYLTFKRDP